MCLVFILVKEVKLTNVLTGFTYISSVLSTVLYWVYELYTKAEFEHELFLYFLGSAEGSKHWILDSNSQVSEHVNNKLILNIK